jgi:hypothetical protein
VVPNQNPTQPAFNFNLQVPTPTVVPTLVPNQNPTQPTFNFGLQVQTPTVVPTVVPNQDPTQPVFNFGSQSTTNPFVNTLQTPTVVIQNNNNPEIVVSNPDIR